MNDNLGIFLTSWPTSQKTNINHFMTYIIFVSSYYYIEYIYDIDYSRKSIFSSD